MVITVNYQRVLCAAMLRERNVWSLKTVNMLKKIIISYPVRQISVNTKEQILDCIKDGDDQSINRTPVAIS